MKDQWFQQNECKTKSETKNTTNEYRYFLESNFFGVNRLFSLVYTNADVNCQMSKILFTKRHSQKLQCYHQWKELLWPSNWLWYKTIRKNQKINNRTGWDYTTGCLLDYDYIKNHHRLIAVDLSKQEELDADPNEIQQTEFIGQL